MTNSSDDRDDNIPASPNEMERDIFGRWSIILRNVGGMMAIFTMCITSILNSYTTHMSVANNAVWPSEITLLITNIGLVVCAWTWLSSQKILKTIFEGGGAVNKLREKAANMIAPTRKDDEGPQ